MRAHTCMHAIYPRNALLYYSPILQAQDQLLGINWVTVYAKLYACSWSHTARQSQSQRLCCEGRHFSHIQGIAFQDKTESVIFSDLQVSDSQADSRLLSTKTARYCSSVTNRQSFNTVQKDGELCARQDNLRAESADWRHPNTACIS